MKHLFFISFFCVCIQIYAADSLAYFARIASEKDVLDAFQKMSETNTGSGFNSFQLLVDAVDNKIQSGAESLEAEIRFFKSLKSDDQRMAYVAHFSEDQKRAMEAALKEYLTSNGREDLVEEALEKNPDTVEQSASSQPLPAAVVPRESSPVVVKQSKPKKKKVVRKANQNLKSPYSKGRLRSSKPISGSAGSLDEACMFQCSNCWTHIKGRSFFEQHMLLCKKH